MYSYGTIKDFDNYVIRNDGLIINIITKRELKGSVGRGYLTVCLTKDMKEKTFLIHRLLGRAFIDGEDANHYTIDHIDQNKLNNDLSNLRWATKGEQTNNRTFKQNKTGELHIHLTPCNTYRVGIQRNNKYIYNKSFKTLPEAIIGRDEFKNKY